jgi:hypothetical protein
MKKTVKQISAVLTALGLTVCGITALATNVSAASPNESVGYTEIQTTVEDYNATTVYPDVIYEDISLDHNNVDATIFFKNYVLPSLNLNQEMPYNNNLIYGTLKDVPASDSPYYFVIDYTTTHASGIYHGVKTDGNKAYDEQGGTFFAFFNKTKADLTFIWDKAHPDNIEIRGGDTVIMKSQIPFYGDIGENLTEPYTSPAWDVTYPPTIPSVYTTAPEEPYIATTAAAEPEIIIGDANLDGKVNINDATLVQRIVAKIIKPNEKQSKTADTNRDGFITIKDSTLIQKQISFGK